MSADTAEFAALRDRVVGHDAQLAHTDAKFGQLFALMREAVRVAGIEPEPPSHTLRRDRHLHLVKGGQP